ncbi:hypothetical protein LAZ67_20001147 [Cordylochernes scorpioides]|uniref:Uncharacterized protein n=1 Tax=Cordylochernes scorpioides TaxID=51811 RepID=A0ABY6LJN8_9ARAC|nr:hypothetical protein LAZ67_20001147 [Cordylochernes scorpioides]
MYFIKIKRFVTCDEKWVYYSNPDTQNYTHTQWLTSGQPPVKPGRFEHSTLKQMLPQPAYSPDLVLLDFYLLCQCPTSSASGTLMARINWKLEWRNSLFRRTRRGDSVLKPVWLQTFPRRSAIVYNWWKDLGSVSRFSWSTNVVQGRPLDFNQPF